MRLRKLLFCGFLLPFLGLAGCGASETEKPVQEGAYFDVPGFMRQQLAVLEEQQPVLQKTVWVNQEKPEKQELKRINWEDELQQFLEIDLNKKALKDTYTVSEEISGNAKTVIYTRKPDTGTPIKLLQIHTAGENSVKQIRAVSEERNALFYSREERLLSLGSNQILQKYYVTGVQKVFLFDSLHYGAKATLINGLY